MFHDPVTNAIAEFLAEIGLKLEKADLPQPTFLPGICVDAGTLLVDEKRLKYRGDLLHEAGHLAVLSADERRNVSEEMAVDPGMEMAAIAWSWAALQKLGLEADELFHADGYKGGSHALIENFSRGRYVGVPLLEWMGLTTMQEFPRMRCWLRDV